MALSDSKNTIRDKENSRPSQGSLSIDYHNLKKVALTFRALNHKLRQQIIKMIDDNKKLAVTDIYVKLRLEQSVASQHLGILRKCGIVKTEREGKFIYYTVNYPRIEKIEQLAKELIG